MDYSNQPEWDSDSDSDSEGDDFEEEYQPFCHICKPRDFTYGNQSCDSCSLNAYHAELDAHPEWYAEEIPNEGHVE